MSRCLQVCALVLALLSIASCGSQTNSAGPKGGAPPASVQVDEAPQGVRLTWSAVKHASYYTVFWGSLPTEYKNFANTQNCSVIISGLTKGELHCFAVTSWGEHGESDYSAEVIYVYDGDPSRSSQHLAKGTELIAKGLYPEAHAYISAAIRLQPQRAEAYESRALLYEKMDEPDLAKKDRVMAEKLSSRKTASLNLNRRQ
jgi:tetratricopeptide (TPR) repeat protein